MVQCYRATRLGEALTALRPDRRPEVGFERRENLAQRLVPSRSERRRRPLGDRARNAVVLVKQDPRLPALHVLQGKAQSHHGGRLPGIAVVTVQLGDRTLEGIGAWSDASGLDDAAEKAG